jgi:hypothetical protein
MRRLLLILAALTALAGGTLAAIALGAGETTGTNTVCATATIPAHTLGVDTTDVYTIPGDSTTKCNTTTFTIPTSTVTSTATSTVGGDPSGQSLPGASQTDSFGTNWPRVGVDNFTVGASLGSFGTTNPDTIVYTGDGGVKWQEYPDGWPCGGISNCYEPKQVLSVHDGMLDFYLHNCSTGPCGANPGPVFPDTGTRYRIHGRFDARFKVVFNDASLLDQYHIAWLLWPQDGNGGASESDFPEMDLNRTTVCAFSHYSAYPTQQYYCASIDLTKWHTFTQEWGNGFRRYYLDGTLLGQATNQITNTLERWQLQTEARPKGDNTSGHLLVDWVWIGS